jgi:hypothetical protein
MAMRRITSGQLLIATGVLHQAGSAGSHCARGVGSLDSHHVI